MPPMTGRVIAGRYNLQHPIGRGAMGVVWRARDQLLDRDVAVKEVVISAHIGPDERRNAYQRTLREAKTAARLSHRGVVAVYDVAEEDGRPWIVMELVPSRSLDQVLSVEGRLQPLRVGRIGQQLLAALAAAHTAGVLHRDVKPSNVLIAADRTAGGWDERAVLTDFGIAQFEGDPRLTQTGMVMGSPGFTAPERIRGGDATSASDLWSLGATLYAASEGHGPYESRGGPITTMTAIINEDAPLAPHAGKLSPLIAALLRRDPSSRPPAATAARMFAQVLPQLGEPVEQPPAAAHPPTMRSAYVTSPAEPAAPASVTAQEESAPEPVVDEAREAAAEPMPAPAPGEGVAAASAAAVSSAAASDAPVAADAGLFDGADGAAEAADDSAGSDPVADAVTDGGESAADAKAAAPVVVATPAADVGEADETSSEDTAQPAVGTAQPVPAQQSSAQSAPPQPLAAQPAPPLSASPVSVPPVSVPSVSPDVAPASQEQPSSADSLGYRPTQIAIPVARAGTGAPSRPAPPKPPGPTFTASSPADRIAPRPAPARPVAPSAAARPPYESYQPGRPQPGSPQGPGQGPYGGATSSLPPPGQTSPFPPGTQYAGPSQSYPDLSRQYAPGAGGGRAERRRGPGRLILLVAAAVVIAIAIGVGAALALHHNNSENTANAGNTSSGGGTGTGTSSKLPETVDAVNHPTAVPAGWATKTYPASDFQSDVKAGFSIGLPPKWSAKVSGDDVDLTGPGGVRLEVDLTAHTNPNDMVAEAKYVAQQAVAEGRLPGYKLKTIEPETVLGTNGAIWQFSWNMKGVTQFTDDIFFVKPTSEGPQSYALYLRAPEAEWVSKYLPMFDSILHTFRTGSA
jgi:eukaryotic-like serine/threonine-protein kinase